MSTLGRGESASECACATARNAIQQPLRIGLRFKRCDKSDTLATVDVSTTCLQTMLKSGESQRPHGLYGCRIRAKYKFVAQGLLIRKSWSLHTAQLLQNGHQASSSPLLPYAPSSPAKPPPALSSSSTFAFFDSGPETASSSFRFPGAAPCTLGAESLAALLGFTLMAGFMTGLKVLVGFSTWQQIKRKHGVSGRHKQVQPRLLCESNQLFSVENAFKPMNKHTFGLGGGADGGPVAPGLGSLAWCSA